MENNFEQNNPKRHHLQDVKKCGARTRKGGQCQQSAMKNGRCRMHGGKSTGPKTAEGKARSAIANYKHGFYTAAAIAERRATALWMRQARQSLGFNFQ
jgi:hypothetical protein